MIHIMAESKEVILKGGILGVIVEDEVGVVAEVIRITIINIREKMIVDLGTVLVMINHEKSKIDLT